MGEMIETRSRVVEYLRGELLGPRYGEEEILSEEPNRRYTTGTLYPHDSSTNSQLEEEEEEATGTSGGIGSEDQSDDPIIFANQYMPGSLGLSFYLSDDPRIAVRVTGAQYLKEKQKTGDGTEYVKKRWKRVPFSIPETDPTLEIAPTKGTSKADIKVLNGNARLGVIWRPGRAGWLVTVTFINNKTNKKSGPPEADDCLYQVELRCKPVGKGRIAAYPRPRMLTDDREEHVLDLLYRRQIAYGVGHGCSVAWGIPLGGSTSEIWTDMLPSQEVPPIIFDLPGYDNARNLYFLSLQDNVRSPEELIRELSFFVDGYGKWIDGLIDQYKDIPHDLEAARDLLLERLREAYSRMKAGVRLLERDAKVRQAFNLANKAMLMQMVHSKPDYAGRRRMANEKQYHAPDLSLSRGVKWRPFQLAFQLLTLASVAFPDDQHRSTVDLIWFPTGGGKTEAYLAVTAFLIFYRRMMYGSIASGTAVLMRYTLRLLTTQQFRRASALICACEQLRKEYPDELGSDEISIGLWVGDATTPNTYKKALIEYNELLLQDEPKSRFQIDRCPWCGTEIVPSNIQTHKELYGIQSTAAAFHLFCPSNSCPFHHHLPIGVVDEQLYDCPPTLLLGTVDKFARMPWEERVAEFFGGNGRKPPELIIQDELHLISGPLGTIVGMYETAIDALVSWAGPLPKILASTATIRRAEEQCTALYSRSVELFPPSGLDASDSYFARYDSTKPGRLYIGILGAAHTASTSMIRTSSALLQAPIDLKLQGEDLDAYWTLVAYHNSLRELGKSRTFGADDIPARIQVIAYDQKYQRALNDDNVQELTSNIDATRLGGMLERLERHAGEDNAVSLLLCSNMLSVGVDVQRLGVMLVNGQPKSTSEYIQATSRVGRGKIPGLVVCVYSPSKPRDRSHYERFVGYHSALYRQVEPTSVTPFAQPARDRAIHAILVTLVRYKVGLAGNKDAGRFSSALPNIGRIIEFIVERVAKIDARELEATTIQVDRLLAEWDAWAKDNSHLEYSTTHKAKESLLFNAGDTRSVGWPTLQSMRNVDQSCLIKIVGA